MESSDAMESNEQKWTVLSSIQRRVLGVLIEKAKTTPDIYPMTVKAICTGCNQKSNRFPVMTLEPEEVEETLESLREMGAVTRIEGYGRVEKFRHLLYDWLGVEKVELSVMGELLLRGAQTEGELRGRAARMDPIADVAALRPILASLKEKGLVVSLTPEGRGHVLTHALYKEREMEKLRAEYAGRATASPSRIAHASHAAPPVAAPAAAAPAEAPDMEQLRKESAEMRELLAQVVARVEALESDIRGLKEALGE